MARYASHSPVPMDATSPSLNSPSLQDFSLGFSLGAALLPVADIIEERATSSHTDNSDFTQPMAAFSFSRPLSAPTPPASSKGATQMDTSKAT
jgi:hypothetical protein